MRISVTAGAAGSVSVAPRAPKDWFGTGVPNAGLGFLGDTYERTSTGDVYQKRAAGWVLQGNRKGPPGDTGETGPMGTPLTGTAAPSNGDGVNGQVYFRTYDDGSARSYYIKAAGAWGSPHDMRGPAPGLIPTRTITESGALVETDLGKIIIVDSSSSVTVTLPDTFERGWWCVVVRKGSGAVIFDPDGSATLGSAYTHDRIGLQHGEVMLKLAYSATAWLLTGETAAA